LFGVRSWQHRSSQGTPGQGWSQKPPPQKASAWPAATPSPGIEDLRACMFAHSNKTSRRRQI